MTVPCPPYEGIRTPAIDRLAQVADALGEDLREKVVFIGGSILPFLQTDHQVFGSPRPTKDVDAVVVTQRYSEKAGIESVLRDRRFRHDVETSGHADRWKAPDGTLFDLVSCGDHLGGTGNKDDLYAIESAVRLSLPPCIRHASSIGFLLLKCRAFHDRGMKVPLISKDLADIVALIATRPALVAELSSASPQVQDMIREGLSEILENPLALSSIPSHIADREPLSNDVEARVLQVMSEIQERS